MAQIAQNTSSLLKRPGDRTLYTVWISHVSTIRLLWDQMTDRQRLAQIGYELEAIKRQAYVAIFNPCGLP